MKWILVLILSGCAAVSGPADSGPTFPRPRAPQGPPLHAMAATARRALAATRPTTQVTMGLSDAEIMALPDSYPELQARINAARAGATVSLSPGRIYKLSRGLTINKRLTFDGRGAWLALAHGGVYPYNFGIIVKPDLGKPQTWSEDLKAGQTAFKRALPKSRCWVRLGTDPYDPNESHYSFLADNGEIPPLPYDINGRGHSYYRAASDADGAVVKNVNFVTVFGVTDYDAAVGWAKGVSFFNLGGTVSMAWGAVHSENILFDGFNGRIEKTHPAGGRLLACWMTRGIWARNARAEKPYGPALFAESWADTIVAENWDLTDVTHRGNGVFAPAFLATGGAKNIIIRNVKLRNQDEDLYLFDTGGNAESWGRGRPFFKDISSNTPLSGWQATEWGKGLTVSEIP